MSNNKDARQDASPPSYARDEQYNRRQVEKENEEKVKHAVGFMGLVLGSAFSTLGVGLMWGFGPAVLTFGIMLFIIGLLASMN